MSAHGAGKAYAIGLMMGLMSKGLTYDEAKWVTLHPAGKGPKASGEGNKKGVPALIDGTTGKILGGFFSVADNLIGNKEAAPNLNRWLDEHLSFKSSFEK